MKIFQSRKKHSFGFSLAELLVTIGIVSALSLVVVFNYSSFNDKLIISSDVQDLAINIRKVQVYGLSVKESTVGGGDFNNGYGIYLTLNDPNNYYLFIDRNNNGNYDGTTDCASSSECLEKVPFRKTVSISTFCGAAFGGSLVCPPNASVRGVSITFVRPNTDANIRFVTSTGTFYGGLFQTCRINLSTAKGKAARISIENTGQVSVQ